MLTVYLIGGNQEEQSLIDPLESNLTKNLPNEKRMFLKESSREGSFNNRTLCSILPVFCCIIANSFFKKHSITHLLDSI